jgi:riboflavin kinase/FMN adenylyltransferase
MDVYSGLERFVPPARGIVLTIGNFDGVHRGHARIIETARQLAARWSAAAAAMTFEPHPLAVLAPERAPAVLTTAAEKLALLAQAGVELCIVLRSEPALLAQQAEDFLASLVAHCRPRALVEGPDFNFGRGRAGSTETLARNASRWGYESHVVETVRCTELPTAPTIKSSSIRQALLEGRVAEANAMLGRPYRIVGTVDGGEGRGATLGFPTANLTGIVHLLPQEAVYAAVAQLDDGRLHLAAVNVGPQPTFAQRRSRVEAFLLDYGGSLQGRRLGLHLLVRLRGQVRFAGPEALVAQLRRDVEATRRLSENLSQLTDNPPIAV